MSEQRRTSPPSPPPPPPARNVTTTTAGSGESGQPQNEREVDPGTCAHVCYYILAFFAYWFGARFFDADGDGDFDPEDVQKFLRRRKRKKQKQLLKKQRSKAGATQPAPEQRPVASTQPNSAQSRPHPPATPTAWTDDVDGEAKALPDQQAREATDAPVSQEHNTLDSWFSGEKVDVAEAQEDQIFDRIEAGTWFPIFVTFQNLVPLVLWAIFAFKERQDAWSAMAGLDSIWPGKTTLRLTRDCDDLRLELWRWLSYQFTHVGLSHVGMNCLLNLMLGIGLEAFHGWWRMALMYNIGVIGGACAYAVSDVHTVVVGMSGGCYSLFGIHFADLIINWHEKKFRHLLLCTLLGLIFVDILHYFLMASENTSNAAHFGGWVAGLLSGIVIVVNQKKEWWEPYLRLLAAIIGLLLVNICLVHNFALWPPRNLGESDSDAYCWLRLVYNPTYALVSEWRCVRCADDLCVGRWSTEDHLAAANDRTCGQIGWIAADANLPTSAR